MDYNIKESFIINIKEQISKLVDSNKVNEIIDMISTEYNKAHSSELNNENYLIYNNALMENFLNTKLLEGLSKNTIKAYKYSINYLIKTMNFKICNIDINFLRNFFAEYSKKVALTTVDNMRRNLSSFFVWLTEEEYIHKNPMQKIKKIKYTQKFKTPLTTEEVGIVRDYVLRNGTLKEIALIDLLISTGIRCEEISKIKLKDCNFQEQTIKIQGKGAKERVVYMNVDCHRHLTEYLNNRKFDSEWLFCNDKRNHNQCSKSTIGQIMKKLGKLAKVEKCQVHRFRKYFATSLFKRGLDIIYIQQLLGHSKLDTTRKCYLEVQQNNIRNQFQNYAS